MCFNYEDVELGEGDADERPVIDHMDLSIKPGQTIALVGPSGGGKSTTCSLLPRFYDVAAGSISIDGQDVRDVTQQSLRRAIGLCSRMSICLMARLARTSPTASRALRQERSPRPPSRQHRCLYRVASTGL